jgi:hypothetical protein
VVNPDQRERSAAQSFKPHTHVHLELLGLVEGVTDDTELREKIALLLAPDDELPSFAIDSHPLGDCPRCQTWENAHAG